MALLETGELVQDLLRRGAGLGEMALQRLRRVLLFLFVVTQLDCTVAVLLDGLDLRDNARTSLYHCARHDLAGGIVDASHTNFFSY